MKLTPLIGVEQSGVGRKFDSACDSPRLSPCRSHMTNGEDAWKITSAEVPGWKIYLFKFNGVVPASRGEPSREFSEILYVSLKSSRTYGWRWRRRKIAMTLRKGSFPLWIKVCLIPFHSFGAKVHWLVWEMECVQVRYTGITYLRFYSFRKWGVCDFKRLRLDSVSDDLRCTSCDCRAGLFISKMASCFL